MKRLQIVAKRNHSSVGEWVRRVIRSELGKEEPSLERQLNAIAKAIQVNGPTADIEQMNREIEEGYASGLP